MKLIADSGSTKTMWYLSNQGQIKQFFSNGINPIVLSTTKIRSSLVEELMPQLQALYLEVEEIYFYGAGCSALVLIKNMEALFKELFPNAKRVLVKNDIWASIYASCKHQEGISCILGTGSNAAVFDGHQIVGRLPSLGYLLGDEGSGNDIGKRLLNHYFYREMPEALASAFDLRYGLKEHQFIPQLYAEERPNQFLAQFAHFAGEHRASPFIQKLLKESFSRFVEKQLLKFKESQTYPIHFIGSIAAVFEEELTAVLATYKLKKGNVLKSPFPALLDYHLQ